MLMELDKKFAIICNVMNLAHKPTRKFLLDGKFKLISANCSGTFICADGREARV